MGTVLRHSQVGAEIHTQLLTDCGIFYMPSNSRHGTHTFNYASTQYLFTGSAGTRTLNLRVRTFRWRHFYRMSYPNRYFYISLILNMIVSRNCILIWYYQLCNWKRNMCSFKILMRFYVLYNRTNTCNTHTHPTLYLIIMNVINTW